MNRCGGSALTNVQLVVSPSRSTPPPHGSVDLVEKRRSVLSEHRMALAPKTGSATLPRNSAGTGPRTRLREQFTHLPPSRLKPYVRPTDPDTPPWDFGVPDTQHLVLRRPTILHSALHANLKREIETGVTMPGAILMWDTKPQHRTGVSGVRAHRRTSAN